jgi:TonB family protein
MPLDERIDLVAEVEEEPPRGGVSYSVIASAAFHILLIVWFVHNYHPVAEGDKAPPIARYVELIRQNPRDFTEAPGKKVDIAPLHAAPSDANRRASSPNRTGDQQTLRPGDGSNRMYVPQERGGNGRPPSPAAAQQQAMQQQQQAQQSAAAASPFAANPTSSSALTFRQPQQASAAAPPVDLRSAIQEVGKVASLGTGRSGADLGQLGGDKGWTANQGPISFETSWYDWGDYAEGMVSRIRVHWYAEMPMHLLQTGMKGVVIIRFTIHRDGHITDVTILSSSGIPPYDNAAKRAIELASPLAPLPADFPKDTEHVTAGFFYNSEPPNR